VREVPCLSALNAAHVRNTFVLNNKNGLPQRRLSPLRAALRAKVFAFVFLIQRAP
jgi:hypothetical protein